MKTLNFSIITLTILLLLSIGINAQATGSPDLTFDTDGRLESHLYGFAELFDMIVQPDKKILVIGVTYTNDPPQMPPMPNVPTGMIARFNEDGTRDMTFGGDGVANDRNVKEFHAGALLPDGRIVVGGYCDFPSTRFCIDRFNADGTLDTTFDGDGRVETNFGYASIIYSIEIMPDGKIWAIGFTMPFSDDDKNIAIARYNADGSLDTSFGDSGRVATDFGDDDFPTRSVIQPDGKVVIAGYYVDDLSGDRIAAIYRYNADGTLDTGFGTGGRVSRTGGFLPEANDVALQSDGKIIIVGSGIRPVRYNSNGTLDTAFTLPTNMVNTWSVAIQANGKIFVRASSAEPGNTHLIIRYSASGTPEVIYPMVGGTYGGDFIFPPLIRLAPDGKIVAGGTRLNSNFEIMLARFLSSSTAWMDFDSDAKTDISIFRPSVGEWWISKSSNGGNAAYAFGNVADKIVPADYTGDSRADVAVFRPSTGEWFVLRSEDSSYYSFPFGTSGDIPMPADYDGDNKADAAVFRPSDTTWYIARSSGGVTIQQFGLNGDIPVASDYDGDTKADIAIYRPSLGQWWINRTTAGLIAYTFGNELDKPVQGDYTGDGKTDVAIWRDSTGEWFILRSENASYYSFPFGASTDIPTPGDYDGDAKADAAIFRPADSTWYVQRSTAGTLIQIFGTKGDQPLPSAFIP